MRGELIHQIYMADGFEDDCDALIHRCLGTDKLNFELFCEIWKDMKFDSLYVGRTSGVEIAELSEELVYTAKQFMMANHPNFEETVAGLFLVYGVLNIQPYQGFAVLRIVPSDVPIIKRIEMTARRERRHDVLYVLGAILTKHSQFHAEQRERGLETPYLKYVRGYIGMDRSGFKPRGSFHRQTEEFDLIRELSALTDRYEAAKNAVTGGKANPSLSFINTKLPGELNQSLKKLISGIPGLDDDDEDINEADVHYSKVQAIKDKAMKIAVGSIKHLTSATEMKSENLQPKEPKIKSKPEKVKTCSPIKKNSTPKRGAKIESSNNVTKNKNDKTSPKKQKKGRLATTSKIPAKRKMRSPKVKAKKSKKLVSDSSSDTDIDISEHDDSEEELNLDTFDKPNEETESTQIEIDNLPTHLTAEGDGQIYEIEIIDDFAKTKAPTTASEEVLNESITENEVAEKNIVESPEIVEELKPKGFKKPPRPRIKKPTKSLVKMGIMPTMDADIKENTRRTRSSTK